jgi:SAM-dependent methyltransferase
MTTTGTFDWTAVAQGWDENRGHVERMKEELSRQLLAQLELRQGQRVLELGAGTGEFARQLAAAVGPQGHVVASDVAPGMVELQRTTLAGLDNAEVAQLDAFDTGLPAGSFDAVVFRMGLMLIDEPDRVLRECHRVLAPGGRLAVAVWAGPEHNPWMTCVGMAAMMHGLVSGGPPTGPGGMFSLADPTVLERAVVDAGFRDVVVHEVQATSVFATTDEHFDTVTALAGPLSLALRGASEDVRAATRRTAAGLAEAHRTPDGIVLPGRALVCTAVVAGG